MENGKTYTQIIEGASDGIRALSIMFGTNIRRNEGTLNVRLKQDGEELYAWEMNTVDLNDNVYQVFKTNHPIWSDSEKSLILEITDSFERGTENQIAFYSSWGGHDAHLLGDEYSDSAICVQWTFINRTQ